MTQRERDGDGERQAWGFLHCSLKFLIAGKHDSPDGVAVGLVGLPLAGLPLGPQARALLPIFSLKTDAACVSDCSSSPAAHKEKASPGPLQDSRLLPRGSGRGGTASASRSSKSCLGETIGPLRATKRSQQTRGENQTTETDTSIRHGGSGQPKQAAPAGKRQLGASEDRNRAKESASKSAGLPGSCLQLACICTSSAVLSSNRAPMGSGSSLGISTSF